MDSDADLEAMCDLLDDDDEEENVRPVEAPVVASSSNPRTTEGGPEPSKTPASSQLSETDALKQQMAEMQKQMALLQQKLQNAESSSPQAHKGHLKESNFLTQDGASVSGAPRSPPRPKNPFEEIKVSDRVTQKFVDGNKFGPSLPKRSLDRRQVSSACPTAATGMPETMLAPPETVVPSPLSWATVNCSLL